MLTETTSIPAVALAFADWGEDCSLRAVMSATAHMHSTGCRTQPDYSNYFIAMFAVIADASASSFNCLNFDTAT